MVYEDLNFFLFFFNSIVDLLKTFIHLILEFENHSPESFRSKFQL